MKKICPDIILTPLEPLITHISVEGHNIDFP